MSNIRTLRFNPVQYIVGPIEDIKEGGVSILCPHTHLLHDVYVGMKVGTLGKITQMIKNKDGFYCFINGSFYTVSIDK